MLVLLPLIVDGLSQCGGDAGDARSTTPPYMLPFDDDHDDNDAPTPTPAAAVVLAVVDAECPAEVLPK